MKKVLFIITLVLTSLLSKAQDDSVHLMYSVGFGYQYPQFDGVAGQMLTSSGKNYSLDAGAFTINFACHAVY